MRQAYEILRTGLKAHPDHINGRLLLGELAIENGHHGLCTREMARILSVETTNLPAMKLLGRALLESDQYEEAWVILNRAAGIAPTDDGVKALVEQAAAAARLSRGGYRGSVEAIEFDEEEHSYDGPVPIGRIDLSQGHAQTPQAFTDYIRSVSSAPSDHDLSEAGLDGSYSGSATDRSLTPRPGRATPPDEAADERRSFTKPIPLTDPIPEPFEAEPTAAERPARLAPGRVSLANGATADEGWSSDREFRDSLADRPVDLLADGFRAGEEEEEDEDEDEDHTEAMDWSPGDADRWIDDAGSLGSATGPLFDDLSFADGVRETPDTTETGPGEPAAPKFREAFTGSIGFLPDDSNGPPEARPDAKPPAQIHRADRDAAASADRMRSVTQHDRRPPITDHGEPTIRSQVGPLPTRDDSAKRRRSLPVPSVQDVDFGSEDGGDEEPTVASFPDRVAADRYSPRHRTPDPEGHPPRAQGSARDSIAAERLRDRPSAAARAQRKPGRNHAPRASMRGSPLASVDAPRGRFAGTAASEPSDGSQAEARAQSDTSTPPSGVDSIPGLEATHLFDESDKAGAPSIESSSPRTDAESLPPGPPDGRAPHPAAGEPVGPGANPFEPGLPGTPPEPHEAILDAIAARGRKPTEQEGPSLSNALILPSQADSSPGTVALSRRRAPAAQSSPSATPAEIRTRSRGRGPAAHSARSSAASPFRSTDQAEESPTPPASRVVPSRARRGPGAPQPKRPATPPAQPRSAVDLLDIPLDPGEFDRMPPKPSRVQAHKMPPDLDSANRKLPAHSGAGEAAKTAGPAPRTGGRGPVRAPPLPARDSGNRRKGPGAQGSDAKPPPPPPSALTADSGGDGFPEAGQSAHIRLTDAVGDLLSEQHQASQSMARSATPSARLAVSNAASPQTPPPGAGQPRADVRAIIGQNARRKSVRDNTTRVAIAVVAAVLLLVSGLSIWQYRSTAGELDTILHDGPQHLADGNYASRLAVYQEIENVPGSFGVFARIWELVVRATGGEGLAGRRSRLLALAARAAAEQVVIYGEQGQIGVAQLALKDAMGAAPDAVDTALAHGLLAMDRRAFDEARSVLADAADAEPDNAHVHYARGLVALADGNRTQAIVAFQTAVKSDPGHVGAHKALADQKAHRGDYAAAFQIYRAFLNTLNQDHMDTRIALARLRIDVAKNEHEAIVRLEDLLKSRRDQLSSRQTAAIHDSIGHFNLQLGKLDLARKAFKAASAVAPENPRFAVGLAELDILEFKLDEAERVLRLAAVVDWNDDPHHTSLARIRSLRGDPQGTLTHLGQVSDRSHDAILMQAQALLDLGNARRADELLTKERRRFAGSLDLDIYRALTAFRMGRKEIALRDLRKLPERRNGGGKRLADKSLPYRALAMALADGEKWSAAETELKRAVAVRKDDFRAYYQLCQVRAARLRGKEAQDACNGCLKINPAYRPAAELSAEIAEARLNLGRVVTVLAPFIEKSPRPPDAVRRLSRAYVGLGKLQDAAALGGADKKIDEATRRYIQGLVAIETGELKQASMVLNAASDELDHDPWVQIARAEALMRSNKPEQAGGFYRRAMKAGAGPEAALGAAQAWLHQKRWVDAIRSAKEAERVARTGLSHPRLRAEALALQAKIYLARGRRRDLKQAARLLSSARRIEPGLANVEMSMGRLAEIKGDLERAATHFKRATEVAPKNPEAQFRYGRLLRRNSAAPRQAKHHLRRAQDLDREGRWGVLAGRELSGQ